MLCSAFVVLGWPDPLFLDIVYQGSFPPKASRLTVSLPPPDQYWPAILLPPLMEAGAECPNIAASAAQ